MQIFTLSVVVGDALYGISLMLITAVTDVLVIVDPVYLDMDAVGLAAVKTSFSEMLTVSRYVAAEEGLLS